MEWTEIFEKLKVIHPPSAGSKKSRGQRKKAKKKCSENEMKSERPNNRSFLATHVVDTSRNIT